MEIKRCPSCGSYETLDKYIFIECCKCGVTGPKMNGGKNDDHADRRDHELAIEGWNKMPRRRGMK